MKYACTIYTSVSISAQWRNPVSLWNVRNIARTHEGRAHTLIIAMRYYVLSRTSHERILLSAKTLRDEGWRRDELSVNLHKYGGERCDSDARHNDEILDFSVVNDTMSHALLMTDFLSERTDAVRGFEFRERASSEIWEIDEIKFRSNTFALLYFGA